MKTIANVTAYKIINFDTNETLNIALSFSSLVCMYHLNDNTIKAYPKYSKVDINELEDLVNNCTGYVDFIVEYDSLPYIDMPNEHLAIAKIDILN